MRDGMLYVYSHRYRVVDAVEWHSGSVAEIASTCSMVTMATTVN